MGAHETLKSWELLNKPCLKALHMLQDAVDDPDQADTVPILWVSAVTLLHAVGHVLEKVDASKNAKVKLLLDEAWPLWKRDPVFQQLEKSRNTTLKEFDVGWDHVVVPTLWGEYETPEEAPNLRHYGFLTFRDEPGDAMEALWSVWTWWTERIAALGHLIGDEPISDRGKFIERFKALR